MGLAQYCLGVDNFTEDGRVQSGQVVLVQLLFDPLFVLLFYSQSQLLDVFAAFQEFVVQGLDLVIFGLYLETETFKWPNLIML